MDLEQAVVAQKEETAAVQTRMKERNSEIRRLKCQIEDQKCVRDMLQKTIAEERRMERPNVPLMCKNLEGLRKKQKAAEDSARALTEQDSHLKHLLARRKSAEDPAQIERMKGEIAAIRAEIAQLKGAAFTRWNATGCLQQKRGALAAMKMTELEALNREFSAELQKAEQTKKALQQQIAQAEWKPRDESRASSRR
jgi:hypothetical protein